MADISIVLKKTVGSNVWKHSWNVIPTFKVHVNRDMGPVKSVGLLEKTNKKYTISFRKTSFISKIFIILLDLL